MATPAVNIIDPATGAASFLDTVQKNLGFAAMNLSQERRAQIAAATARENAKLAAKTRKEEAAQQAELTRARMAQSGKQHEAELTQRQESIDFDQKMGALQGELELIDLEEATATTQDAIMTAEKRKGIKAQMVQLGADHTQVVTEQKKATGRDVTLDAELLIEQGQYFNALEEGADLGRAGAADYLRRLTLVAEEAAPTGAETIREQFQEGLLESDAVDVAIDAIVGSNLGTMMSPALKAGIVDTLLGWTVSAGAALAEGFTLPTVTDAQVEHATRLGADDAKLFESYATMAGDGLERATGQIGQGGDAAGMLVEAKKISRQLRMEGVTPQEQRKILTDWWESDLKHRFIASGNEVTLGAFMKETAIQLKDSVRALEDQLRTAQQEDESALAVSLAAQLGSIKEMSMAASTVVAASSGKILDAEQLRSSFDIALQAHLQVNGSTEAWQEKAVSIISKGDPDRAEAVLAPIISLLDKPEYKELHDLMDAVKDKLKDLNTRMAHAQHEFDTAETFEKRKAHEEKWGARVPQIQDILGGMTR